MGKIYVTDTEKPESAFAFVGCFGFFAGRPDRELVSHKPSGFVILVPQNEAWSALIEECYPAAKKVKRYAIKKNTIFDVEMLQKEISNLPPEYELKQIDADLYAQCLENPVTADFVSAFESKEQYLKIGRGILTSIAVFLLFSPILKVLRADGELSGFFTRYYRIMLFTYPLMVVGTILGMFLRVDGKPQICMLVGILSSVLNAILDFLFVGRLSMGVQGSAIASLIVQIIGVCVQLAWFLRVYRRDGKCNFHVCL